jgi:murein tripeptide amidase MpaA
MAANFGHKMKLIHIGKSSEGRDLKVVKIGNGDANKAAVFIDGGIHAREWVSPASVTYLIHRMVETEGEYDRLLSRFNVYILPVVNPDGYEYSRNHDRMWRKTRSRTGKKNLFGNECHGVDPNRNFGYHWGGYGASEDACKETYRGPHAFSEPETLAMKNFLLSENADFKLYLTFHSYGQYILYPWGYDKLDTRDFRDLKRVGDITGNALKKLNGASYQIGSAAKMLYPASGGSDDWAKGGAGIKFSYTVELPDTGRHGFILPARHIKAVGFQATTVVKAMLTEIGSYLPK